MEQIIEERNLLSINLNSIITAMPERSIFNIITLPEMRKGSPINITVNDIPDAIMTALQQKIESKTMCSRGVVFDRDLLPYTVVVDESNFKLTATYNDTCLLDKRHLINIVYQEDTYQIRPIERNFTLDADLRQRSEYDIDLSISPHIKTLYNNLRELFSSNDYDIQITAATLQKEIQYLSPPN